MGRASFHSGLRESAHFPEGEHNRVSHRSEILIDEKSSRLHSALVGEELPFRVSSAQLHDDAVKMLKLTL